MPILIALLLLLSLPWGGYLSLVALGVLLLVCVARNGGQLSDLLRS